MQEDLVKLNALKNRCDSIMKFHHSSIPVSEVDNVNTQFLIVRAKLHKERPDLFDGYELQNYKSYGGVSDGHYSKFSLRAIKDDISYYVDIIQGLETVSMPNLRITNEGLFFSGQYFEALSKLVDIIKTAKTEIIFIDGYVDEKILNIFSSTEGNIAIKLLTKSKSVSAAFTTLVSGWNKQYKDKLEIKTSEAFHDRFLIIDQKEFYHIGASMKDAGSRGFMFSRIEEPFIQKQLIDEFNKIWI